VVVTARDADGVTGSSGSITVNSAATGGGRHGRGGRSGGRRGGMMSGGMGGWWR